MEVVRTAAEASRAAEQARQAGRTVGLVPTMGAYHDGHRSLMRRAREECDVVLVYLFVNPLQFGAGEDFDRYPRDEAADVATAEREGADVLFLPTVEEMYPGGYPPPPADLIDPGQAGAILEGASRDGHFAGVLTVVDRLFAIVGDGRAYFGEKDAQQLFLVREMAKTRHPGIAIVACPIVREPDGLAMSSRNVYLSDEERAAATCLYRALQTVARERLAGESDAAKLRAAMAREIGAEALVRIDYAEIVDEATFEPLLEVDRPARALVAATLGTTRLIDNLKLAGS